jgi:tetratricopeptide (TPR) repeat protein
MMLLRTLTAPSFFAALALAAASVRTATDSAVPAPTVQEPEAESWRTWVEELAPPYIRLNGRGPNRDAVQPLLEFLLIEGGPPSNAEDLERARMMVFERLLPNLEADHCAWIVDGLQAGSLLDLEHAHSLLLAAAVSESGPSLLRAALDEDRNPALRAACIARLIAAEGRPALDSLQALIDPQTEALLLKQIYTGWASMVVESDLPRLEELVRLGPGLVREFALQTWARVETRADKRVEILRISEGSASSFRTVLFREVATQGPAPELAAYVRSMFDAPRSEDRRLALASFPTFASPEAVFAEWQARRLPHDALDTEGRWMNQLARLPLDQAQQAAASWLLEKGWREPRFGPAVASTLGQTAQMDALLGSFLRNPDVPQLLRVQLAADRAGHSEEARAWIRSTVPSSEGLVGVRLVRALGEQAQAEDHEVLAEIAGDPARAGVVRAEAARYLARVPGGLPTLRRLVAEPPLDFETAEAVVEAAILSGDSELRAATLLAVREGFGRGVDQADESEALWRTLWRAQAREPLRSEASTLLELARTRLGFLPEEDPTAPWPDPRALRGDHTSLVEVVQARAATAPARTFRVPESGEDEGPISRLGMAVWAEAALENAPDATASIAARLAAEPGVNRGNRMRALGLAARAARRAGNQNAEVAALERILGLLREDLDEADLVDLGYGLGLSSPRAWLLPLDEVGQRLLLAEARGFKSGRGTILGPLLEGGCRVEMLLEAGELLAEVESWSAALRFARRAADFEPSNVRARWQLGRAYEAIDLFEEAREAYQEAVRLGAGDPTTARIAASRLEALTNR